MTRAVSKNTDAAPAARAVVMITQTRPSCPAKRRRRIHLAVSGSDAITLPRLPDTKEAQGYETGIPAIMYVAVMRGLMPKCVAGYDPGAAVAGAGSCADLRIT